MPAFDMEVFDVIDLWLDTPLVRWYLGAQQLPHDLGGT